jgi:hypothetical protein
VAAYQRHDVRRHGLLRAAADRIVDRDCGQFSGNVNGPGNCYAQIPPTAVHLLSQPLGGGPGVGVAQTINFLLPGFTNGVAVYQTYSNVTLNPGDCLVTLYGMQGGGAFDNESQLNAIVQPF